MKDEVRMIPIDQITILNPRHRDRKNFAQIVQSNRNLGLKKPIQVSVRSPEEGGGAGYDLVCGQGWIEAFQALGFKEIPAIVVEVTKDGINEETADLFKDKPACAKAIRLLKRVTGLRQIEIADLMVSVNNCTAPYAKGHVAGAGRRNGCAPSGSRRAGGWGDGRTRANAGGR